jgi:dolichol-phosphate mannosyltransferase
MGELKMKISLIIPAFNEAEGVSQTATAVRNLLTYLRKTHDVEVVFVNDGSKDDTANLLQAEFEEDAQVRVISHEVNKGLGAAMRTGFQNAKGEIIISTDFDGTYPLNSYLDSLVSCLPPPCPRKYFIREQ